jgi:hypothetical protein
MRHIRFSYRWAAVVTVATVAGAGVFTAVSAQAATGCRVTYTVTNQWPGGFGADVQVANLGDPVTSWRLTWSFGAGQTITQLWNGSFTQSGANVTVTNASWNGNIPTGGTASFGFNGSWTSANPVPTSFALNGTTCTGSVDPTTSPSSSPSPSPSTSTPPTGSLPSSLRWSSSGVLAGPKPDAAHSDVVAIKDYTVVRHNNAWQVYATTASPSQGWNLVHFSFSDWPQAAGATHTYLDTATPIGRGYRAAPHIFYFAPQNLWYMVYQTGLPTYSTSTDPSNPRSWSTPRNFMNSEPAIVTQNKG